MTKKTESPKKKYKKQAFIDAENDRTKRIVLKTLLEDGESYTKGQVTKIVDDWEKKEAK